jgi:succinate dehydrogenase/fumarate reductase flavoprotein subunit
MGQDNSNMTRRDFVKGAAVTVAAVAGGAVMAGCAPKVVGETSSTPAAGDAATNVAGSSASTRLTGYCGEGDWLGTAPAVADADIASTVDVDVVIVGGGNAGVVATLGAADKGAKVAVIEKQDEAGFATDYWHRLGEDIGHVNSQWLLDRGFGPYDTGEITAEFVKRAAGRCDPDIIRLFVENSGAMFDRLVEVYNEYADLRKQNDSAVEWDVDAAGTKGTFDFSNILDPEYTFNQVQKGVAPEDYPIVLGGYKTWPTNAMFFGPIYHEGVMPFKSVLRFFVKYIVQKGVDLGAQWFYEHTALVLTQDESGAVTGVIAQDKDGKYVKFNAAKGVVMAAGDYIGNPDMCWALLNESQEFSERAGVTKDQFATAAVRNGQGHKMCIWAGGMLETTPRGSMVLGGGVSGPWGAGPMLQLNANAKRFTNEAAAPLVGQAALRQPKGIMCLVTDKKFMQSVEIAGLEHGGPNYGRPVYYEEMEAAMGQVLGSGAEGYSVIGATVSERNAGTVYGANTLEELAGYLGYEGDLAKTFVESVNHYNELCYAGVDSDYGKDAIAMIPIDEAPFYGCKGENSGIMKPAMVTMSGIIADDQLRVLDKDMNPIKGLFVCGNTLGGRYGAGYSTPFAGNSIGMAMTHGWLAGKNAAQV